MRRFVIALTVALGLAVVVAHAQDYYRSAGALIANATLPVTVAINTNSGSATRGVDVQVPITATGGASFITVVRGESAHGGSNAITGIMRGGYFLAHASSSGNSGTVTGAEGTATLDASYTGGDTALYGLRGVATNSQTANVSITNAYGVYGSVLAAGTPSGQINTAMGFESEVNIAPATVGHNAYGYYLLTANAGSGDAFGYYVSTGALTGANKFAFRSDDATAPSVFVGGTRAPIYSTNTAPGTIASAATIAPTTFIDHITGTVAIVTITVPGTCAFACTLNLIPDAAYTTTTAGNIGLASTATIGRVMIMVWDGTKWWPSY